jgi:hypothetical protein
VSLQQGGHVSLQQGGPHTCQGTYLSCCTGMCPYGTREAEGMLRRVSLQQGGHVSLQQGGHVSLQQGGHVSLQQGTHVSLQQGGHVSLQQGTHVSLQQGGHPITSGATRDSETVTRGAGARREAAAAAPGRRQALAGWQIPDDEVVDCSCSAQRAALAARGLGECVSAAAPPARVRVVQGRDECHRHLAPLSLSPSQSLRLSLPASLPPPPLPSSLSLSHTH